MFYLIDKNEVSEIKIEHIRPEQVIVGYLTIEEFKETYRHLGISEIELRECMLEQMKYRTSVDVYDKFSFGVINVVDVLHIRNKKDCIAFFLKKNLFICVEELYEN